MTFASTRIGRAILCGFSIMALAPVLHADPVEDIKSLLANGNARAAYQYGKNHPDELGNPTFDFYFGIAAIDDGHAGEGVLALERYTINYPENLGARLELARGYFVMGDDQRARQEFYAVRETNPPASVVANIDRFLAAMNDRESNYRLSLNGFIEGAAGLDTNANGGLGNAVINLPGFGDVTVADEGLSARTGFQSLAAGGQIAKPLAPGFAFFARGRLDGRFHRTAQQFDQNNVSGSTGFAYVKNKNSYRTALSYSRLTVDDNLFRNVGDVSFEWHHLVNELNSIQLLAQHARLRYPGANEARNANFSMLGLGFRKAFIRAWKPQATASVTGGVERNIEERPDLGRSLVGSDIGLAIAPASKWTVSTSASFLNSLYQAEDLLTLTRRKDHFYGLNTVAAFAYTRRMTFGAEFLLARNDSNLALYEYNRGLLTFRIRYEFK